MTAAATDELEGPRSKRRMILEAAVDHFGEVGFEHTKWATVAKDVGIGQTALYHYFESKTHCLLTIMSAELLQAQQRSRVAVEGISDPEEVLRKAVASAFEVTQREALQARILLSHQDLLVAPRPSEREEAERVRARELVREIEATWAEMLRAGMDAGVFPERDERVLVRLVLGLVNSVWRWYRPKGPQTLQEVSDIVVEACVRLVR
ncbi:TetR/AcrR family transcriptional regulator [Nocardioides eburneiflavus]|uniref:TetR/AcrR family transcriptional regulator n=1 Tax=Nocardioides eburneiflavus TaxID=2518372 RepID=A0A4Z1CHC5_9ACTN|nr:TetR/AcrR family transcriptional regulator [Nocardioides eburneiflavus]TGN66055.1 TetR/AcrR family transcriptional regulator [Nocardioides eburneiflavus]